MKLAAVVFALAALILPACAAEDPGPGGDDQSTGDGDPLPFMSECTLGEDAQCETDLCFDFSTKGPHCTHECTVDTDCEAPSPGCNGMGVCKAPDGSGGGTGGGGGDGSGGA